MADAGTANSIVASTTKTATFACKRSATDDPSREPNCEEVIGRPTSILEAGGLSTHRSVGCWGGARRAIWGCMGCRGAGGGAGLVVLAVVRWWASWVPAWRCLVRVGRLGWWSSWLFGVWLVVVWWSVGWGWSGCVGAWVLGVVVLCVVLLWCLPGVGVVLCAVVAGPSAFALAYCAGGSGWGAGLLGRSGRSWSRRFCVLCSSSPGHRCCSHSAARGPRRPHWSRSRA